MIRYLKHDQIDQDKWDACINASPNGLLYAFSWYLNMTAPGWHALVEGDYRSVMPLPRRRKWGIAYAYQPFFVQQLGIFSTLSLSEETTRSFVNAIPPEYRWVHLNLNTYNPLQPKEGEQLVKRINCELDLISPYEQLRKAYSNNTRRNLRKAENSGLFITHHGQPEVIIDAFRQNRGKQFRKFTDQDYLLLRHLVYSGIHRGLVNLRCAYTRENNFCAGIIFFKSRNKQIFLFSGATAEARQNAAMHLLVDDFIRQHAAQDLVLDFEGSSDANLARFYLGFGSKECVFLQIKINRLPGILKPMMNLLERVRGG